MTTDAERFLVVGAALFVLGAIGFLTRRNLILMVLSTELMLHGVSLTLVTFGRLHHTQEGQAFTIFVLTVAACEADLPAPVVEQTDEIAPIEPYQNIPHLTPAGLVPKDPGKPGNYSSSGSSKV